MTPTNTEALAARLESGWCPIESPTDMEQAAAALRRLSAERAALRADAERYRWLLANYPSFKLCDEAWHHGNLDAAIDAMLAAMKGTK